MQLAAVTLARVVGFVEPVDLNPTGRVNYPALATALVERYGFLKFPQKAEDFDESKGVLFQGGKAGDVGNLSIQIWTDGIVVDTTSSTDDSEKVLEDALVWGSEKLGLTYRPDMIKRKAYVSQLTFYSDMDLGRLHPAISKVSERLTHRVPQFFGQKVEYSPTAFFVGFDLLTMKAGPAPFTVERRINAPFAENKFFSSAPLPTKEHINLLEEFEKAIKSASSK